MLICSSLVGSFTFVSFLTPLHSGALLDGSTNHTVLTIILETQSIKRYGYGE